MWQGLRLLEVRALGITRLLCDMAFTVVSNFPRLVYEGRVPVHESKSSVSTGEPYGGPQTSERRREGEQVGISLGGGVL